MKKDRPAPVLTITAPHLRPRRGLAADLDPRLAEAAGVATSAPVPAPMPAAAPAAESEPVSPFARLLRRVRLRKITRQGRPDRFRVAPRAIRLARLVECVPAKCESAEVIPGCPLAKCRAKGCGCDYLHAGDINATCPRSRWPA